MKIILLILFFNGCLFCQLFTERFNRFFPDTSSAHVISSYIFNGDNAGVDHTSNADLNYSGSRTLSSGNPIFAGDSTEFFDNSDHYGLTSATHELGTTFTILSWIKPISGVDVYMAIKFTSPSFDGYALQYANSSNRVRLWTGLTSNWRAATAVNLEDGQYHCVAVSFNAGTASFYIDGIARGTSAGMVSPPNSAGKEFTINDQLGGYGDGNIASVVLWDKTATLKEIREEFFLADGWKSRNGNVIRADSADTWQFNQGFFQDTISVYIGASSNVSIAFDAYSPGGGSVNVWTSGQDADTKTLTSVSSGYTSSIGPGDSLFFARATSDTIYIDNVIVSLAGQGTDSQGKFKKSDKYRRFKRF
jgi:hypothetical protein